MAYSDKIKRIHTLKKQLGWSDDIYRAALEGSYGVTSCKELTESQKLAFIDAMRAELPQRASVRQIWKIKTDWAKIDYSDMQDGDKHLSSFLSVRFKVEKPEALTPRQAHLCIQIIQKMINNKNN